MFTLDHLAVGCADLAEGVVWVEERLGVTMLPGGQHAHYGTHNRLLGLAPGLYLEVIAKDPDAVETGRPAWFGLDDFAGPPRLANWLCRADDMDGYHAMTGPSISLKRGNLTWETTVPHDGSLPMGGGFPSLIRWGAGVVPPSVQLPDSGCQLVSLTVTHPDATWLAQTLDIAGPAVVFEEGPMALSARIETPNGICVL